MLGTTTPSTTATPYTCFREDQHSAGNKHISGWPRHIQVCTRHPSLAKLDILHTYRTSGGWSRWSTASMMPVPRTGHCAKPAHLFGSCGVVAEVWQLVVPGCQHSQAQPHWGLLMILRRGAGRSTDHPVEGHSREDIYSSVQKTEEEEVLSYHPHRWECFYYWPVHLPANVVLLVAIPRQIRSMSDPEASKSSIGWI